MSAILCEHCLRPVFELRAPSQLRADGRVLHLSCEHALDEGVDDDDDGSVMAYDVEVRYSGYAKVRVIARSRAEAEDLAQDANIDVYDADVDIEDVGASDKPVSEKEYERYIAVEQRRKDNSRAPAPLSAPA